MAPDVPFGESRVAVKVEELLSIVLVTSPVPSNPSTQMLEHVLSSCTEGGGLEACQKIIVSDAWHKSTGCNVLVFVWSIWGGVLSLGVPPTNG